MSYDDPETSQLVLDAVAGRRPNARGKVRTNCPFCETIVHKVDRKQCLEVSMVSGWWKCYRCESEGHIDRDELPFDPNTIVVQPKGEAPAVNLPEGFVPLWLPEGQTSFACAAARKYIRQHRVGVTQSILEQAKIGACVRGRFMGRVVVPIYKAGRMVGYVGRAWRKKHPMAYLYSEGFSRSDTLYNEDALYVTTDEPVLVVEGVFDTFPFFPNAVAVLGKPSYDQVAMLCNARRPILIVFDGDAHAEATSLARQLRVVGKRAAALRLPPGVDPDECVDHVKQRASDAFAETDAALTKQAAIVQV